jgi:ABC-type Mn2+/Zn2+ transport system ATPase subunit
MSFGQQQRVFLARALAQRGEIIVLDEPMTGVDATTQDLFIELLHAFHDEGKTIVMATHDLNQAVCVCDTLVVLNQRLVAAGPVGETFTPAVLQAAYGGHIHFLTATPDGGHAQVLEDVHHHDTDRVGRP